MAKALDALGVEEFESNDGNHRWREELFAKLKREQQADGSWVNSDARWLERTPIWSLAMRC